jgi:multidrug efflux pump subunit AcrB
MPYGTPLERTAAVSQIILKAAQSVVKESGHPELSKGVFSDIGKKGSHTVEVRVFLADAKVRESIMSTVEFVNKWREKIGTIPGAEFVRLQADRGGPGGGSSLTIELQHTEMGQLEKASTALAEKLQNFPRVKDIEDGFQPGKEQLDFRMKPEGLSLGLNAMDVGRQVRNFYEGAEVARQQRGRDEIKIKVRLPKARRLSEHDLDNLTIRTPQGTDVPLMEVVNVTRGRAYTTISRRNGQRTVTVQADVTPTSKAGEVITALNQGELPELMDQFPGLNYSFEGRQARNRESLGAMKLMLPLIMFGIYALLAIPFRSYMQPLIVMISIPFGLVGAVIGHLIMGYSLSIIGLIGIIALSGVVVNDALVLIDFANQGRKKGLSPYDAVVAAGIQRFRPIMLTTLTTFGGLAPMIFETSRQARFLIPMALSLGFGILFATVITLMLIPALYMINEDIGRTVRKLFNFGTSGDTDTDSAESP